MKRSTVVSFVVAVFGFGILVPWWKGFEFLDATIILACTCVSLVFIAPAIASSFKREHVGRQILRAAGFAWLVAALILINGIATVNIRNWLGQVLLPSAGITLGGLLLNLTGGIFLGLVTAESALRTNKPTSGVATVRAGFFLILMILVFLARFAPPSLRSQFDEMMTSDGLLRILLVVSGILAVLSGLLWKRVEALSRR
jgi:hypothetical protein